MRLFPCLALLSLMGLVACQAVALTQTPTASPSPLPSSTPLATPSATLRPPSPTPEPLLLEGRVTAPLNIRRDPSTTAEVLATLSRGETVQADLQSQDGQWYRIRHAGAPEGFGWVSARYLELTLPASAPTGMTWGRVTQRLNVRSGPGTSFESLGVLETQSPVLLTGKNRTASWLCIQYPFGTKGSGWVAAQYVKADDLNTLPTLDESGRPLRLETPEAEAQLNVPTPTLAPA
ncbi:MAG: SH3 domain-containing protein, partial [Anaerolineales bacterium]|nr:SH3 domain-containing protein [Anaerolineales bacterium]